MFSGDRQTSAEDKRLNEVLGRWNVQASLPPRFQDQVWSRIARAEARKPEHRWLLLGRWLESLFRRQAFTASYLLVLLLAGLGAGFWQVRERAGRSERDLRTLYVQTVDPYQMPRK